MKQRTMYSTSASPLTSALMAASGPLYASAGVSVRYPPRRDVLMMLATSRAVT